MQASIHRNVTTTAADKSVNSATTDVTDATAIAEVSTLGNGNSSVGSSALEREQRLASMLSKAFVQRNVAR